MIMFYKRIWDIFSDRFGRTILHPQFFAKKYAWEAVEIAEAKAYGVLLDIGCGRMPYRDLFLRKVSKYIGLDHPKTAKLYHGKFKPDIYANASKIPLKDRSIDTVIMFMVLEHLPDPEKALKEIKRITKKNGVVVVSTVQLYPIHDEPYDFLRYTKYGLKELIERSGLKLIKIKSQGNFWSFWGLSLNVFLFQIILSLINKKDKKILAIILLPFFYCITLVSNILCFFPSALTKSDKSTFNISHVAVVTV